MTSSFSQQLANINTTFSLALDEFRKNYVLANVNKNIPKFEQALRSDKETIKEVASDMFELSNNIDKDIEQLSQQIETGDKQIERIRNINKELEQDLETLMSGNNASKGQLVNIKKIANTQLYYGIGLLLAGSGFLLLMRGRT